VELPPNIIHLHPFLPPSLPFLLLHPPRPQACPPSILLLLLLLLFLPPSEPQPSSRCAQAPFPPFLFLFLLLLLLPSSFPLPAAAAAAGAGPGATDKSDCAKRCVLVLLSTVALYGWIGRTRRAVGVGLDERVNFDSLTGKTRPPSFPPLHLPSRLVAPCRRPRGRCPRTRTMPRPWSSAALAAPHRKVERREGGRRGMGEIMERDEA